MLRTITIGVGTVAAVLATSATLAQRNQGAGPQVVLTETITATTNVKAFTWLLRRDQGVCWVARAQGEFAGSGEAVEVSPAQPRPDINLGSGDKEYWRLIVTAGGGSNQVSGRAACLVHPGAEMEEFKRKELDAYLDDAERRSWSLLPSVP